MAKNEKIEYIKVASIAEEKEYIRKLHPEFQLLQQFFMRVNIDGKLTPVDKLHVKTNDGEKDFYFDISGFF